MKPGLRLAFLALLASPAAGCGGDGGTNPGGVGAPPADAERDAPPAGTFGVTSSMLTEGGAIATVNTCDGANTSPALAWRNAPAGTMSFAVVLTDKTNGLVHSVIYDIPSTATGLPANVEKTYAPANVPGAHQTAAYNGNRGYAGPCPPAGTPHTYEFAVHALNAAALPGTTMATTRPQAVSAIQAADLASTTLTGTYTR